MTQNFIKRHCEQCELCLFTRRDYTRDWEPDKCGKITKDGDGIVYGNLETMTVEQCRKGYKK